MMNGNENGGFKYTYSASEQAEIKKIREKYSPKNESETDKMERVRRLDNSVTAKAQAISLVFGVIGTLILGFGMSLIMSELSEIMGLSMGAALTLGIILGIIGGILASLAYPIFNFVLKRERKRVAPEIISLTEELMK